MRGRIGGIVYLTRPNAADLGLRYLRQGRVVMRFHWRMPWTAVIVSSAALAHADNAVINTTLVCAELGGTWQLQTGEHDFKQELSFGAPRPRSSSNHPHEESSAAVGRK